MFVWQFDFTIYVHFQPTCFLAILSLHKLSKKQIPELLKKHFEQEVEQIITSLIIRGQNDRVYYGIGPGMYCVIKLN